MTSRQFDKACQIAKDIIKNKTYNEAAEQNAFRALDGFGLPGEKKLATLEQVAYLINWQAFTFSGEYDMRMLAETRDGMMENVTIINI